MQVPDIKYRASVQQFTETETLDVIAWEHPTLGKLVNLVHRSGSLHFHFSMTPTQAKELADHLVEGLRVLEGKA